MQLLTDAQRKEIANVMLSAGGGRAYVVLVSSSQHAPLTASGVDLVTNLRGSMEVMSFLALIVASMPGGISDIKKEKV